MTNAVLNVIGLAFATVGGIGAALCSPAPKYNADGSVNVSSEPDKAKRIAMHRRQKLIKPCLALVGIGALLQLAAMAF